MPTPEPLTDVTNWDDLTADEQHRMRGNLDPWLGPVDPDAQARSLAEWRRQMGQASRAEVQANTCGCWMPDCDDCGHRMSDGKRPAKGQAAAWWKRVLS